MRKCLLGRVDIIHRHAEREHGNLCTVFRLLEYLINENTWPTEMMRKKFSTS